MAEHFTWESFKAEGGLLMDKVKEVIHQGNVRRVIVEHGGRTIAEFPLTVGVVGAVLAPVVAAIAAILALVKDCTIHVERIATDADAIQRSAPVRNESARAN
jgi:uncharacterized protein DUF4342